MKTTEILEKIKSLNKEKLDSGYALFEFNPSKGVYFGIDCNNRIALVIESCNEVLNTRIQTTRELKLMFNITSSLKINNLITEKKVHILICNSTKDEDVYAFLMLAQSFIQCEDYKNYSNICELFLVFVDLFSQDKAVNHKELQGFYAELYTILYVFEQKNLDISRFWQSKDKMKFDFSISENKRIEVKSTVNESRIHHFKHEQLLAELYDIKVVSMLLRKDDTGLSLKELINKIKYITRNNFNVLLQIEKKIHHVMETELESLKFDEGYTKFNIRFFESENIPRFPGKTPEQVSQAEYNSNLSGIRDLELEGFVDWIIN